MQRIVDAHSHYMPPAVASKTAFFKAGWSDIDRQLSVMDACGIEKALLVYPTSDAHIHFGGWSPLCAAYNPAIAEVARKHKGRFIAAGILPVDSPDNLKRELKRVGELGMPVISMASSYEGVYLDDPRFDPVWEYARDHGMPVHIHSQIMSPIGEERVRDPLLTPCLEYVMDVSVAIGKMMMSGTFLKFPDVHFIFAHFGGVIPFLRERFDTTYQMLRARGFVKDLTKNPSEYFQNLYFDISGTKSYSALACALETVDASRILFGSDFPANKDIGGSVRMVEDAPLPGSQKAAIFENRLLVNL